MFIQQKSLFFLETSFNLKPKMREGSASHSRVLRLIKVFPNGASPTGIKLRASNRKHKLSLRVFYVDAMWDLWLSAWITVKCVFNFVGAEGKFSGVCF